jgi:hypothetical protein
MSDDYPGWLLELVNHLLEFEEEHPTLYRAGEVVSYDKPVEGEPRFTHEQGRLVGEKWTCFQDDITQKIPADVVTAAIYFKKGQEAAQREQAAQGQEGA